MDTIMAREQTEGERIIMEVCQLLETVPPDDFYADMFKSLVVILRNVAEPERLEPGTSSWASPDAHYGVSRQSGWKFYPSCFVLALSPARVGCGTCETG